MWRPKRLTRNRHKVAVRPGDFTAGSATDRRLWLADRRKPMESRWEALEKTRKGKRRIAKRSVGWDAGSAGLWGSGPPNTHQDPISNGSKFLRPGSQEKWSFEERVKRRKEWRGWEREKNLSKICQFKFKTFLFWIIFGKLELLNKCKLS